MPYLVQAEVREVLLAEEGVHDHAADLRRQQQLPRLRRQVLHVADVHERVARRRAFGCRPRAKGKGKADVGAALFARSLLALSLLEECN